MTQNLGGNALAKAFVTIANKISGERTRFPVFGTIDGQLNLLPDGFSKQIPPGDYSVSHSLSLGSELDPLKPNDRVLCIPIEDGHTYVITARIKG
ncbi:hypothetical protein FJQ98_14075 [Lysinibacillus agricola]|uniref:DUF2577 domain-containing protein n=1 Tax=Lysinibacillus agricola TaxID=2590012 RepID=A0ABX7AML7_9BACI|nr:MULTISPECIES: hypothetical protein [Lysinibacillus]KOS64621.1 hypothetical protein AN161_00935 [Lysinibacillus sp. FJAT-14222]QQP10415.1 hypothetical protein FJQ98_14075 [Lysinibacillus agricola]